MQVDEDMLHSLGAAVRFGYDGDVFGVRINVAPIRSLVVGVVIVARPFVGLGGRDDT
jgi:hypothetical protein